MVHGKNRIPYWIDRSLTGLAGPDYDATISFGLPFELEDSQYGKSWLERMKMSDSIEELLREAYSSTHDMLKDSTLGSVVQHGLLISYGPPIPQPDLLLLSFQGGGESPVVQETWPRRLLYANDPYKFGTTLRGLCRDTGLYSSLQSSAMAFPAVFPQAPSSEAGRWMKKTGPHAVWRRHSADWVERLVKAINPRVVIIFGNKTSEVFDLRWEKIERFHSQNHQTYGESTFQGAPAVFCHHLSQGFVKAEALKCFRYAKRLISEGS